MYSSRPLKKFLFPLRRHVTLSIILLLFTGVIIVYINVQSLLTLRPSIMHFDFVETSISCHYADENDALSSAEDRNFMPRPNSIFFHVTSCRGGLSSRQACAIESASRAHPMRQVYVMFSAPVSQVLFQRSCITKLRRFANIKFARVHISDYARNTPLEDMVANAPFNKSMWQVEHTSDILRYLTLYKWGGVYLDTDVLVVKSLTPLGQNWVAKESDGKINAAVIAISMDHIGRTLADAVINEVSTTYRPDLWNHNGPGAITRVLHKMCQTTNSNEWSSYTCHGIKVYNPEYIYPIHYLQNEDYFKTGDLKNVENAYTHHLWNKLTYDKKIEKDSPYEKMAQTYCPNIYEVFGEQFGSEIDENDALPSAEAKNFIPRPNSIFFHETSCRGGLNSRQACAIESASRAHPRRQVYVMFSGPVSEAVYQRSSIAKLRRFVNIKFARVHISDYARNTPLESLVTSALFNKSQFRLEHTSDVLRYLTLYKWGGVYLDTDMLVVKSLTPLGDNWVGKQDSSFVNAAAIAISTDPLGRKLVEALINELRTTYRPDLWIHNGPGAITRVLRKLCRTIILDDWSSKTCQGLKVYSHEYFFPLHYSLSSEYFIPGEPNLEYAYTLHFWNKLTHFKKIEKNSPYEKMARKYCPTIYEMYGQEFGL